MFKRTETQHTPTEGAGLGSPPEQPWESEPQAMMASGAMHLDGVAAKFDVGKDYTTAEAKKLIRRVTRTPSYDHATVDAVFTSLLSLGALRSVEWHLGPKVVRRNEAFSTPRTRRKATREQYVMCMNEIGEWQAVRRSDAPAFRRRITLFHLDADEREAQRKAEQRRRLREEVEAEARA